MGWNKAARNLIFAPDWGARSCRWLAPRQGKNPHTITEDGSGNSGGEKEIANKRCILPLSQEKSKINDTLFHVDKNETFPPFKEKKYQYGEKSQASKIWSERQSQLESYVYCLVIFLCRDLFSSNVYQREIWKKKEEVTHRRWNFSESRI